MSKFKKTAKLIIIASLIACFALVPGGISAEEAALTPAQEYAVKLAEQNKALTVDIASALGAFDEVGLAEYKSYVKVTEILMAAGFKVDQSAADIPTAVVATYGSGKPVVGIYEDYDSLPGVGHGCGHNLNTAAGVTAAIALKDTMQALGIKGTLKLYVTPAEEIWDVAPVVAGAGFYDGLDVLISVHAGTDNVSEFGSTMAMDHVEYKFKGVAAHASAAPQKGKSALDAVELMNIGVNFLREHLIQEMRIHYVITDGGAAPNVVPATAASRYFIRGPKYPDVIDAREKIDNIAKGAALMAGVELEIGFSSGIYNKVGNKTLALMAMDVYKAVGAPSFSEEDKAASAKLGFATVPTASFKEPTGSQSFGSNPIGDVTWKTPTTTVTIATWVPGTAGHSVEAAAQSVSAYGFSGAVAGSKVLAALAMKLFTDGEALAAVKAEFDEKMKGMPEYVGKAMIPEVAYAEAPGIMVDAAKGLLTVDGAKTAFEEKPGDKLLVSSMAGAKLAELVWGADAGQDLAIKLQAAVKAGERVKVSYVNAAKGYTWFYGYVHAK
ncbi:MAG: p-aminobenzoyl-glutamate hydrolase subunit B [Firmicutes bacterium ADurb.Bin153]|nr:MAG: p-aminobenzoyl-glutamate hydrolase subunit B [Firmicutes bacterium ADurb.Bin153]